MIALLMLSKKSSLSSELVDCLSYELLIEPTIFISDKNNDLQVCMKIGGTK